MSSIDCTFLNASCEKIATICVFIMVADPDGDNSDPSVKKKSDPDPTFKIQTRIRSDLISSDEIHPSLFSFHTMCPRSSDPYYIGSYYMKWVTTSWTYSIWQLGLCFNT